MPALAIAIANRNRSYIYCKDIRINSTNLNYNIKLTPRKETKKNIFIRMLQK